MEIEDVREGDVILACYWTGGFSYTLGVAVPYDGEPEYGKWELKTFFGEDEGMFYPLEGAYSFELVTRS